MQKCKYLAIAFIALCWGVSHVRAADLVEMMPEGTMLYVGWPGIDTLTETANDTSFSKLMNEPEMLRFRQTWSDALWPAIVKKMKEEAAAEDPTSSEAFNTAMELLDAAWKYPTGFGLVGVSIGDEGPQVDSALIIRAGQESARLVQLVDSMFKSGNENEPAIEIKEVEDLGTKWKEFTPPGAPVSFRYGVLKDDFIFVIGKKVLRHLGGGSSTSLAKSPRYAAAMKTTGGSSRTPVFYLDIQGLIATLEHFQPMMAEVPILGEEGDVKKLMESMNLQNLESISVAVVPEAGGFKTTTFLHAPRSEQGANALLSQKPLTDNDLKSVAQDASWATVANFDLIRFYDGAFTTMNKLSPDMHAQITEALQGFEQSIGLKLRDDFIGAFGDTWTIFDSPSNGSLFLTGITFVAEVKPDNKLDSIVQAMLGFAALMSGESQNISLEHEDYRGQKITYLNVKGIPMPVAPAWVEYEGKWIAALYPQVVRITLDRFIDKGESLLDNLDFQRARKLIPPNASSLSYADTPKGMRVLYSIALPVAQMLIAMAQGEGIPANPALLPAWPTIAKHLYGDIQAVAETPDGIMSVSHGPLPFGFGGAGMFASTQGSVATTAMMVSILLPSLARARELSKRTASAANLKGIGTAMYMYANDNKDQFPPSLETLIENELISPKALISPRDVAGATNSYIYLPGQSSDSDQRNIVAYENPDIGNGEGSCALYADSHVEWLSREELEEQLAETRKRMDQTEESAEEAIPPANEANQELATPANDLANVNAIVKSCLIHAETNKGKLPPDLRTLTKEGTPNQVEPSLLKSSRDHTDADVTYVYLSGQMNTFDPRNVVVYEDPDKVEGDELAVGFLDGHVIATTRQELETLVVETMARISEQKQKSRKQK